MPRSRRWSRSPASIHLILGGKDKGSDYSVLNALLAERVKRVYTIGAAAQKIESQMGGTDVVSAGTLDAAVKRASESATAGDIVLLAPACASFDQFDSYEHRGRVFKELVRQMASREQEREHAGSVTRGGKSNGQAGQRRQVAVRRHPAAGVRRAGHGLQRLGGDGQGALRLALQFPAAADGVGRSRHSGHGGRDEHRLPQIPPAGGGVHVPGITSLLLIAVFLFRDSHNTHRWIKFGGFSFQPSELAKPAIILYLAYFLESRWQQIADWKNVLLPAAAPTLLLALLIVKEPDLGTAMACVAIIDRRPVCRRDEDEVLRLWLCWRPYCRSIS